MKGSRMMSKAVAWALCALLACMMLPAAAFAGGEDLAAGAVSGGAIAAQGAGAAQDAQGALGTQSAGQPSLTLTRAQTAPLVLKQGSTYALGAKASSSAKITYISAAPERVSVSKAGKLKARATGTAVVQVSAKSSGGTTKETVRVRVVSASAYKAVKSISSKIGKKALHVGQSADISTTFSPSAASNKNLIYQSLTPKVASVSAQGKVSAKAPGAAKVCVASAENSKATCVLTFEVTAKVVPKFKSYSWAELKSISKEIAAAKSDAAGLAIAEKYGLVNANGKLTGAKKSLKLTDGTKATVRILGFRQDKLASGGLAGISFEFASVPTTDYMNFEGTNEGGWAFSDMRSWLNSDFYKKLPADLRACIAPAKKKTNNVGQVDDENDTSVVSTTRDKLWLLSMSEVYGKLSGSSNAPWSPATYEAEGKQYKLYADKKVTTSNYSFCKKTGAYSWWWLRSPYADTSGHFRDVNSYGDWNVNYADNSNGVSPGFCF